jgi:uncharacterized protein YjbJ (UPF0337 family)
MVPQREFAPIQWGLCGLRARNRLRLCGLIGQSAHDAFVFPYQKSTEWMKEIAMNKDQAAGGWKELKGKIKQQWGKLTDDDLTVLEGSADELSGRIQKRYGIAKEEAEKQIKTFRDTNNDLVSRW